MHKTTGKKQSAEHIRKRLINQSSWKKTSYWLGKKIPLETRIKISEGNKRNARKGEKNHNWKGGISKEHNRLRHSLEYVLWRNEVYKRDRWTCKICNKRCQKGNIVAHHLKLFSEVPELRFTVTNGITLCRKCHIEIHKPHSSRLIV